MKVFIQNEAGSNKKNLHNEKTLEYKETITVSRAYPYPYGFILNTTTEDGCNLDCFVITRQTLKTGQIVECEPFGLMEQIEDNQEDHNILAVFPEEGMRIDEEVRNILTEFVIHVFSHIEGKEISVGRFMGKEEAITHIEKCSDF